MSVGAKRHGRSHEVTSGRSPPTKTPKFKICRTTGKRGYTKKGAKHAMTLAEGVDLSPYRCRHCDRWHLTSG